MGPGRVQDRLGKIAITALTAQPVAKRFDRENHAGAGGEERFRLDDRHGAAQPVLMEMHGRGGMVVIAVEDYDWSTGTRAADRAPVENEKKS
jgi:hypothetical protein